VQALLLLLDLLAAWAGGPGLSTGAKRQAGDLECMHTHCMHDAGWGRKGERRKEEGKRASGFLWSIPWVIG
jgi:hypothetical protein